MIFYPVYILHLSNTKIISSIYTCVKWRLVTLVRQDSNTKLHMWNEFIASCMLCDIWHLFSTRPYMTKCWFAYCTPVSTSVCFKIKYIMFPIQENDFKTDMYVIIWSRVVKWGVFARSRYQKRGQIITYNIVGCNYWSLPLIPAVTTALYKWIIQPF